MTARDFRSIALSLPETCESAHVGHPDFRVLGKIFATLGWPDENWGVLKLSPEGQKVFVHDKPAAFVPVKGEWGRRGNTKVRLEKVDKPTLRKAMVAAWQRVALKGAIAKPNSRRKN
jgi:hypothetical protein